MNDIINRYKDIIENNGHCFTMEINPCKKCCNYNLCMSDITYEAKYYEDIVKNSKKYLRKYIIFNNIEKYF